MLMLPVIFVGWTLAIVLPAGLLFGVVKLVGVRAASSH